MLIKNLVRPTWLLFIATVAFAQNPPSLVKPFIVADQQVIVLRDVRVIDGTGAAPNEHQTITISGGKIASISPASNTNVPAGARVLELAGYTVIPGLVGMHDHMFYPVGGQPPLYSNMGFSFPRLYLAAGVTTLRTTGSVMPYEDLELKKLIDAGTIAGPTIHVTTPYLEGPGAFTPVMHTLIDANDATRTAEYWIAEGATSFKAYMNISRAELAAAVATAHAHHLKITGHLCSIGFREAAELGIDDLEHGLVADTEFTPGKQPDKCPPGQQTTATLIKLDVNGPEVQQTIRTLIDKHVAVTSTLPVFEASVPNTSAGGPRRPLQDSRVLSAMSPQAQAAYLGARARVAPDSPSGEMLKKEMQFELAFAKAGGLLLAGPDPTGNGGVLAGFGDQREIELLVEAGFTPLEAIRIATLNGAQFLGQDRIGSIAAGKQADLIVIKGDPSRDISDIEKVEIVFKNGVGYDSQKLIQSVQGLVGIR
jgi:imidazolonepropionase-like amidohydrolase